MEGGDVWRWVLEFLLYQNRNPRVPTNLIKNLLLIIPASDFDSTLKKTLLLRTLQDHLYTVSFPESILETLELLEELHRRDDSPISAAMSDAYCAVAVECTLKYLLVELCNPTFIDAVNRIWLGRVWHMNNCSEEGRRSLLLSPELERWRRDIETSLWDLQMRERLASIDTRRHAVVKLKAYLDEAWANLGPSFLEIVAALMRMNNALAANHSEAQHHEREIQECTAAAQEGHSSKTLEVQKVAECNLEVNEEAPIESRDEDVPCPHVINNNEAHLMEKDQISVTVPHNDDHRPSLMERNSTARVYEWYDSIDGLEDGTSSHASRFHLPSPKERKLSPLKKYKPASITKRRKPKKWSQLEEETLKTAVDKFGRGNWKLILDSHKDIFEERTEVDLKDKWRNMTR